MQLKWLKKPYGPFFALPFLVLLYQLLSVAAWAQTDNGYTVSFEKETLEQALGKIRMVTGASIAFSKEEAGGFMVKPATYHNRSVDAILQGLLKGMPFVMEKKGAAWLITRTSAKSNPAPADRKNGAISGFIVDEENGEPVVSATIIAGGQTVIGGVDGAFILRLPAGTYAANVNAVGYGKKKVTDITVKDNETFVLNVTLPRQKGNLSGVIVVASAKKEGVAALYLSQKNRASISDGISAEQIARTPDKNLGEILKRVSGVATVDNKYVVVRGLSERYNGSMLNGQLMPSTELNRKQFSFDIIPTNLVENMIVYKTITPDLSAEFGGGLLSVTTRSIPTHNFFTVSGGASYNDMTTGKPFRSLKLEGREYFGLAGKNRDLLGRNDWKNASDVVNGYESMGKHATAFPNNWGVYRFTAPVSRNGELSFGKVIQLDEKHKLGIIGAAGIRNTFQTQEVLMSRDGFDNGDVPGPDQAAFDGRRYGLVSNVSGLAGLGYSGPSGKIEWQGLYLQMLDQQLILGSGYHASPDGYLVGYYDLTQQTQMLQSQLKGEHVIGKKGVTVNWMGSYIRLNRQRPDNHQFKADMLQDVDVNKVDEFNIQSPFSSGISAGALRWWTKALENNLGWNADVAVPLPVTIGQTTLSNVLKTGYAGWRKDRFFYVLNTGSKFNTVYYPSVATAFDTNKGGEIYFSPFGDDFHRIATLHAGYAMLDQRLGNWRLVWGLRAEYYNLNNANALLDSIFKDINRGRGGNNSFDYSDIYNREPNWNLFPSANLTYSLTPTMNLRLAYAKSIVRPDLREMSFFQEYDFELGGAYRSNLVRSSIMHHYDFRYEWYPGAGEVLSLSLFYKQIHYPMEIYKVTDQRDYYLRNNKAAINKGIEVEVRKSLAFTKVPVIRNLTLYANGTFLSSEVTPMVVNYNLLNPNDPLKITPVETILPKEKRPQAGASNYMINGGVYYDTKPVSVSLSYNYVSNRMFRLDEQYTRSLFERPLTALDAQLAIRVLRQRGEIKLNAANLLNSASLVYENQYGGTGVPSMSQTLYQQGRDAVDYRGRPGKTYSMTFAYRF